MEANGQKPSANVQVAVAALVATIFSMCVPLALGFARRVPEAFHDMAITLHATLVTVGLFALPLVWWRRKVGYVCATFIGAFNVLGNVGGIIQGTPFSPGMPQGTIAVWVSQIGVSILVVVFCARAWRER